MMFHSSEIAREFAKSSLFGPTGISFLKVLKRYVEDGIVSLDVLIGEIEDSMSILGIPIDFDMEQRLAEKIVPQVVNYVDRKITEGTLGDEQVQQFKDYTEIIPFQDRRYQSLLLSALFEMQPCFEYYDMLSTAAPLQIPTKLSKYYSVRDDLIDVSSTRALPKGFLLEEENLVIYPRLPYQVGLQILQFFQEFQGHVSLKIVPRGIGSYSNYTSIQRIMEERIFGMPFTKENLRKVLSKKYGVLRYTFDDERSREHAKWWYVPLKELQYVVKPLNDEHLTFSVEEVMDLEKEQYRQLDRFKFQCEGQLYMLHRYVHAIIHRQSLEITHLDYSYFYYDFDAYFERVQSHIKDRVVNASVKRKIFRIDGIVPFDNFKHMLAASLEHNPEVVNLIRGS